MAIRNREVPTLEQRKALRRRPVYENFTKAQAALSQAMENGDEQAVLIAKNLFEAARLDLESFDFERDVTGARKGEALGLDLNGIYQNLADKDGNIDRTKAQGLHLIQINMGELDRLNKIGGHELGDAALGGTCQRIYAAIEDVLEERLALRGGAADERALGDLFEVYRSSGNDFSVVLKGVDQETAALIRKAIAGELPVQGQPPGKGVPLVATHLKMSDVADYWNRNREVIVGNNPGRVFVDSVKEQSQIENDTAKVQSRIDRILNYDPKEAKGFYDEFLMKSLGSLFAPDPQAPLGYEDFLKVCGDAGSEVRLDKALGLAMDDFRARQREAHDFSQTLSKFVLERWTKEGRGPLSDRPARNPAAENAPQGLEAVAADGGQAFLARFPMTPGEAALAESEGVRDGLRSKLSEQPNDQAVAAQLRLAQAKYDNEAAKRNKNTGLYERGVLFREMERALQQGEPMGVVAIDMAFLKYFNIEGGRKTGDLAIKTAARIMEQAAADVLGQTPYRVCRTGGDEFMIAVATEDQAVLQKLQAKISRLANEAASAIPCADQARTPSYRKENLNFNFGLHAVKNLAAFRQELAGAGFVLKAGAEDAAGQAKEGADYLARIADRQVEIEKTIRRFMLLTTRLFEEEQTGAPKGNYETLERYSLKAIGGQAGQDQIRVWKNALAEKVKTGKLADIRELEGEITKYVIDKGWQEVKDKEAHGDFVDKLLEAEVRERFLHQRVHELQRMIEDLRDNLKQADSNQLHLNRRIADLENEIKTVGLLREKISSNS